MSLRKSEEPNGEEPKATSDVPLMPEDKLFAYNIIELQSAAAKVLSQTAAFKHHDSFRRMGEKSYSDMMLKRAYNTEVGSCTVDPETVGLVEKAVQGRNVLSFAAGSGALEACLASKGVKVICTDKKPPQRPYLPVHRLENSDAVKAFREICPAALIVWPVWIPNSKQCPTYQALLLGNFETVVYIGEDHGVTGSKQLERFFEVNYDKTKEEPLDTQPGHSDILRVFQRKTSQVVAVEIQAPSDDDGDDSDDDW